ncbi:arp2/3 complex-activating protein rickA-like [Athalia rosae]|uniref:arp2/3 complex-activating protein rickA-like n=1 Tax=Athalia rosae TaxID=37344 RepID=UPI00203427B7|nr:arp2/3 complex-activating protein rickA-like [Athalia rosae]
MNRGPASKHFENAVSKFEERRCNMVQRQQFLKNKITSMERSIPALMAYNMWVSGKKCTDAPLCKVKEIMATFSPTPDPTDKLLENLKNKVHVLNRETEELHGKIIDTEIELEERGMELDSLESANNELTERITDLEKQVEKTKVPSLHSIHSEDLVCLAKIRQLGHEEVNLKSCIRELEEKEVKFRQQMEQLLTSREFQKDSGGKKMVKRIQELEATEKKMNCALQTHKYNMHQLKKKLMQKEKEITRMEAFLGVDGEPKDSKHVYKRKQDDKQSSKHGSRGSWLPEWMLPSSSTAPGFPTTPGKSTETSPSSPSFTDDINHLQGKLKRCVCPTPASVPCYEKPPCRSDNSKTRSCCNTESSGTHCPLPPCPATPCTPPPCPSPLRDTSGGTLPSCCKPPSCPPPPSCKPVCCPSPPSCKLLSNTQASSTRCTNNVLCKPPECLESPEFRKQDLPCPYAYCCKSRRSSRQPDSCCPPAPCDIGSPCHTCRSQTPCKECVSSPQSGGCRCSCKGKCARGESSVPCNCSADENYRPKGLPKPPCGGATGCWLEEDSDDDFCACCTCGCNESDDSDQ